MSRIYVSVVIDATPAEVWEVVEPIEDHLAWMADAVAIRFESEQRRGVGTRFVCDTRLGPVKLADRMEVTEWSPPEAMGVRHTGLVKGNGRFTLHRAVGGGTLFAWQEELTFPWWLGGALGALAGRPVLRAVWRRNLRTLRVHAESRS